MNMFVFSKRALSTRGRRSGYLGVQYLFVRFVASQQHYSIFFPGRRLRTPFTKSCNEMRPLYWLLYSTNQWGGRISLQDFVNGALNRLPGKNIL
jgi:hypothetical protein